MSEQTAIRWEQDADNIVTLILDDPNQSANTMNELYGKSMASLNKLEASGVISEILERYGRKRKGVNANGGNGQ